MNLMFRAFALRERKINNEQNNNKNVKNIYYNCLFNFQFLSDERDALETLVFTSLYFTLCFVRTPTFLYFDN